MWFILPYRYKSYLKQKKKREKHDKIRESYAGDTFPGIITK